jgi:hypothetical protein
MTSDAANPTRVAPRAKTLAFQGAANRVMRGLLRTPGIDRLVGRRLITLYVVGRSSGTEYAIPVAYLAHEGQLLVGSPFGWGRNLRTGQPVDVRLRGRRRPAQVTVIADEAGVVADYGVLARANKQFAGFNQIRLAADGEPDVDDLRACWAAGARVFRLTPQD